MKFKTRLKPSLSLIDLTPLVDVIFLLLIFFIITSDILPLKSLNIQNPTLSKDSQPLTSQLVVVMDAQNVIYVGSKKAIVELSALKEKLLSDMEHLKKQTGGSLPSLVLSIDQKVDYGSFLRLFAIAQEMGVSIRLVYHTPEEGIGYVEH